MTLRTIWTLTDGKAGMQAQAVGLARALQATAQNDIRICSYTVATTPLAKVLPPALAAIIAPPRIVSEDGNAPSPDMVIVCGPAAQTAGLVVKRKYGAHAVCIQRPRGNAKHFDFIVAPQHDYSEQESIALKDNRRFVLTLGSVGGMSSSQKERQQARDFFAIASPRYSPPYIAILIGGENRAYRPQASDIISPLQTIATATGATLLITPSRRSDRDFVTAIQTTFGARHFVWDGNGDNPYAKILTAADGYCVTADSVNMISEACTANTAGNPVCILPLTTKNAARAGKFARFHTALATGNHARIWRGQWQRWHAPPLNETARAAKRILFMLA